MEPIIAFRELVNQFGAQRVHDGLSMDVERGEVLGIVGGSGTGKSVLLRSILGLHKPTSGTITVLGVEIPYLQPGPVQSWGGLFQTGTLRSAYTVLEHL